VRFLRNLLIFAVVMVGLLAALDVAVRVFVEGQIAQEVEAAPELDVADADASIDSFPFLGKALGQGEVSSFTIDLHDIADERLDIRQLSITGDGIVFDRNDLLNGAIRVRDVESATATLTLTQEAVSEAVGVTVLFTPGVITVQTSAGTVQATAAVVDGVLTFEAPGVGTLSLDLPVQSYLPCPPSAEVQEGQVELSCTADDLPPVVLEALDSQALDG
jgi:hypothetical protein